jgi:phosphoribosyl 1,2-cyclic phosphate phosphodiesterase
MRITILGCGAAPGVPSIGPHWGNCDPAEPRNRRRRVSILVDDDTAEGPLLVDTSPDLREQLLDAEVGRIGAVLYTHAHADHLHGIDDLRSLNRRQLAAIPAYATAETWASIGKRFGYVFDPPSTYNGKIFFYRPSLTAHTVVPGQTFEAAGVTVMPFEQDHGFGARTTGYRFGAAAYSTDVFELSDEAFAALQGIELWILDCLSYSPIPNHAHVAKVLTWFERVRPKRLVLTHMGTDLDYQRLRRELPAGVAPGYDGMVLEV